MKYQVILNNDIIISTHRSERAAEKAMRKAQKNCPRARVIGNFLVSGIYHIRAVQN